MPILLLNGSRTRPFYRNVVDHLSGQLPDVRVREVEGVGHMAPLLAPQAVADELAGTLASHPPEAELTPAV